MQTVQSSPTGTFIRDIMTPRTITLHPDDSLRTAASLFEREHFHHVVIIEHGRVLGVVSDRDLLKSISPFVGNPLLERFQDASTLKKRVHQIMSRKPVTIGPECSVAEAAKLMLIEHVSCLPVVNGDGTLIGIVTVRDLIGQLVGAAASEAK